MEKAKSHPKLDQISKKRKADETEGFAHSVDESSSSGSESVKVDSFVSGNVESGLKSIGELQIGSAGERNPQFGFHLSTETPKASSTPQQSSDEKQHRSELNREKKKRRRRKKSERLQTSQNQIQEGLFHNQRGV